MNVTCKLLLLQITTEVKKIVEISSKQTFFPRRKASSVCLLIQDHY